MDIKIRNLEKHEWPTFRDLSLEFFKSDPTASGWDYEEELKNSDTDWEKKVEGLLSEGEGIILVASVDNNDVGIVMSVREDHKKMHHIGFVMRMFVKSEYRGKGIGKKLFSELLNKLESDSTITKLNLDVTTTQEAAINLYKSFGFEIIGEFKKEYLINGEYYNTFEMEKYIR